jgi:hypothetical protein
MPISAELLARQCRCISWLDALIMAAEGQPLDATAATV